MYAADPNKVVAIILPLYAAHYDEEYRRTEELPKSMSNWLRVVMQ